MNLKKIVFRAEDLSASGKFILISLSENKVFKDQKPTNVTDGFKAAVVSLPDFERMNVKIPGQTLPEISDDEIQARNAAGDFVLVEFEGFEGKAWQDFHTKEIRLSATATALKISKGITDSDAIDFG